MARVTCRCGEAIEAPGGGVEKVVCPRCRTRIRIRRPSDRADDGYIRFPCPCGRRLKVRAAGGIEAGKCPDCGRVVPIPDQTAAGSFRAGVDDAEARNGGNGMHRFSASGGPAANHYVLDGRWEITDEYARLAGSEGDIKLRFKAAKVYVVASAAQPVTLQVTVDGKPQPAVTVQGSQLYALYDGAADGEHVLVLHVPQSGVQVYSFTFG